MSFVKKNLKRVRGHSALVLLILEGQQW